MATMNLYLPDALKADMDEVEGINWSSLAQSAFRSAITERRAQTTMDKQAVAERIRSTAGTNSPKYQRGKTDGQEWAAGYADADDLEAMSSVDLNAMWERAAEPDRGAAWVADAIAQELGYDNAGDIFDDVKFTRSYIDGFVAGADDVWSQVRKLL